MRRALAIAVTGVLACTPNGSGDDDDGTGDETAATTVAEIPEPVFLSPAVGEFIVDTNQRDPEVFKVERTLPGVTEVLLDDLALGLLGEDSPHGVLTEDLLELTVHGAMIAGKHALQLVNPSPEGPLTSVTLTMVIEAPPAHTRPTWRTELTTTDITGSAMLSASVGSARLLGVVTPGDPDPILKLMRAADDGWTVAKPINVPLDGHVPSAMSQTPAVAVVAFPAPDGALPTRMRVAWRVGSPGAAIAARDIAANPTPIVLNTVTVFDLDAALAGEGVEWAALGRPHLLGHTLLAELVATPDTEVPHPGDRRVVTSFWRGDDLQWTPPTQVALPAPTDLDALGPAPLVSDMLSERSSTLSVRLGRAYPALLAASDDGAVTISSPTFTDSLPVSGELILATIGGSFGGRTVASVGANGRVGLSLLNTSGDTPARAASPPASDLPDDATPTGPPAPGIGLGFPFFLIPYGDAAPVQLVLSDGRDPAVVSLDQPEPVHCDAVALALTLAGNDPDDPAIPFACLSHGVLQVGRLIAEPQGDPEDG